MEFIPRQRPSRLADIIAQFASRPSPIAQGVLQAGQSIGDALGDRGMMARREAMAADAAKAESERSNRASIIDLLGKGGSFADPTGKPMDLTSMLGLPTGTTYTPKADKMESDDKTRVEVTPEMAKQYKGLVAGSKVPATYMAELETKRNDTEAKNRETAAKKAGMKILPAAQVLAMNEGKSVARMLPDVEAALKQGEGIMGPVSGRAGSMNPYKTDSKTLEARFRTASQSFGRFMEGGVLRKEDEAKYEKMFPQISDPPDIAKNKLKIVRRMLAEKYEDDRKTMGKSGYDVSGFEELEIPPSMFEDADGDGKPDIAGASEIVLSGDDAKRLAELRAKKAKKGAKK